MAETNVGKWDGWYGNLAPGQPARIYGDPTTYFMAASYLADADLVEDWGCGLGGFRQFCLTQYRGIDGSRTPFADEMVDLCEYRSRVPAILLRHVLEHNHDWRRIFEGALASFQRKLCLIIFTPFADRTGVIATTPMLGGNVPDISFSRQEIESYLDGLRWRVMSGIKTQSQYGVEQIYFVWR